MHGQQVEPERLLTDLAAAAPQDRIGLLESAGDVDHVLETLALAARGWTIVDLDRALDATDLVVDLARKCGSPGTQAKAHEARSQALSYANRFDLALNELERAVELCDRSDDRLGVARATLATMHPLQRLGRYDEAIDAGEMARQIFDVEGESSFAARADVNLGATRRARGDPTAALVHFDRARSSFASEPLILAQVDSNRAVALLDLGRFSDAEAAFSAALRVFEDAGSKRGAAIVEGNLADLLTRQGRLQPAFHHFEHAQQILEADHALGDLARLRAEHADAFAATGLIDEAAELFDSAIPELDRHGMKWEAARGRTSYGQVLIRLGRLTEAERVLDEAVESIHFLEHEIGLGRTLRAQGELAMAQGRPDTYIDRMNEALLHLRERPVEAGAVRYHLALAAMDAGDIDRAESLIDAALETALEFALAPLIADLLHARSRLRHEQNLLDLELADLRAAVDQIEKVRGSLHADRFRAAFVGERTRVYQDLVNALLTEKTPDNLAAAFLAAEQAKSRSLLDLMAGAVDREMDGDQSDRASGDSNVAKSMSLRRELNALYSRLPEPGSSSVPVSSISQWRERVERCARQLSTVESRLASTRGVGGLFAPPADLSSVEQLFDSQTALVEYFMTDDELLAFVVNDQGASVHRRLADRRQLREQVERVQFEIGRALSYDPVSAPWERLAEDARQELATLYDIVLAPLEDALQDRDRVTVVPHGPLHSVPLHALHDGNRYAIEKRQFTYAPSASILRHLQPFPRAEQPERSCLVFGIADEMAPEIEAEARTVAAIARDARLYLGKEATSERLARDAPNAGLIHLACHARFLPSSPLSSGIRLADGWLTVRDICGLRLNDSVVVLSGCDTGRALVGGGDELLGLIRGFLTAGASALILSLWPFHDVSARNLMASLYSHWYHPDRGALATAALRASQLDTLGRQAHPLFWAPLILVGRPC